MKKKKSDCEKKLKILIVLSLIVILGFFMLVLPYLNNHKGSKIVEAAQVECVKNSDCIIIRGSCCLCDEGGAPQCISKNKLGDYTKKLESCSSSGTCFNGDCGKITCGCVDNKCAGQPA